MVRTSPLEGNTLRVSRFLGLPIVLADFGLTLGPILDELRLHSDLLSNPRNELAVPMAARLLALCAQRAKCPHIGLLIGHLTLPGSFGLPGLLAQNSPNVGAALRAQDPEAEKRARAGVQRAKTALGERGTPWWEQSPAERRVRWASGLDDPPAEPGGLADTTTDQR